MAGKQSGMTVRPIGVVRNEIKQTMKGGWEKVVSEIVVDEVLTDAIDGTPVIDIKPFLPKYDSTNIPRVASWVPEQ